MKVWDFNKTIDDALFLCDRQEKDEFKGFLNLLKERDFFSSQQRFFPKKLLNLFKFYKSLLEIDKFSVSSKLGFVFSGNEYLVKRIKLSKRTIQYYLDTLEKYNFLVRSTFVNKCIEGKFHSFRKIKIIRVMKRKVVVKKRVYTVKKYFLSARERFHFFGSLYDKYKRKYPRYYKKYEEEDNPYFYERHHFSGYVPDKRSHTYPKVTGFNKIKLIKYHPITYFVQKYNLDAVKEGEENKKKGYKPLISRFYIKNKNKKYLHLLKRSKSREEYDQLVYN